MHFWRKAEHIFKRAFLNTQSIHFTLHITETTTADKRSELRRRNSVTTAQNNVETANGTADAADFLFCLSLDVPIRGDRRPPPPSTWIIRSLSAGLLLRESVKFANSPLAIGKKNSARIGSRKIDAHFHKQNTYLQNYNGFKNHRQFNSSIKRNFNFSFHVRHTTLLEA